MSNHNNVVSFSSKKPTFKSYKEQGLETFVETITEKLKNKEISNIFAIFYHKEDDSYEVFEVGDYRLNELMGDLELLKDFIKSGE